MKESDWDQSAAAWIASMGAHGDKGRRHVLDAPMLAHARGCGASNALDIGCGEGRFCRMLREIGVQTTGLDPTRALLDAARARDPEGVYLQGCAEALPFAEAHFDLAVFYLSLIDIADYAYAICEAARILKPGGALLVANLAPYATATPRDWPEGESGWVIETGARRYFAMDDYLRARSYWTSWAGIRIYNHHRPLGDYMRAFLNAGLILRAYEEPPYKGPDAEQTDKYMRAPWFNLMKWEKP